MDYQKRLLKFLQDYSGIFTAHDFAVIWKRSQFDVTNAAIQLKLAGRIKIAKDGVLSLR